MGDIRAPSDAPVSCVHPLNGLGLAALLVASIRITVQEVVAAEPRVAGRSSSWPPAGLIFHCLELLFRYSGSNGVLNPHADHQSLELVDDGCFLECLVGLACS